MSKAIPEELARRQELQRQQTINKVLHALDYLDSCGMKLTIKNLTDCTGLSRSVFSKPHIREVIANHQTGDDESTAEQLKDLKRAERRRSVIKQYEEKISRLSEENRNLIRENELLRGQNFLLLHRQNSEK